MGLLTIIPYSAARPRLLFYLGPGRRRYTLIYMYDSTLPDSTIILPLLKAWKSDFSMKTERLISTNQVKAYYHRTIFCLIFIETFWLMHLMPFNVAPNGPWLFSIIVLNILSDETTSSII